jgi:hypothetical protein
MGHWGVQMHKLGEAVEHYYSTIYSYGGNPRDAKKADRHMDAFLSIFKNVIPANLTIKEHRAAQIQGGILNKRWDLAYAYGINENKNQVMELKSICLKNMGKWFNSRVEEAIGVATDLRFASGDNIKLNYFLVVEDNLPKEKEKIRQKNLIKISKFCKYLEKDLKLYDNVCCIVLNSNKNYYCAYSSFETFLSMWVNHEGEVK